METNKSSETNVIETDIKLDSSKKDNLCNSCKNVLPKILDNDICPHCQRRN